MAKAPAIGIDIGWTKFCVSVCRQGRVVIITDKQGFRTTPSYVSFTKTQCLVGNTAKNEVALNPENTVFDMKSLIGRSFDGAFILADIKHWPFKVWMENKRPKIEVDCKKGTKTFSPEEISSMILDRMKKTAEAYLGMRVEDAVITVPAYFDESQRQATRKAATIVGLNVLRILNEPSATALTYGLTNKSVSEQTLLIFDLGGGGLSVSIITIADDIVEVKSMAGDPFLGGGDFTNRLVGLCVEDIRRRYSTNITESKHAMCYLREGCEMAMQALSRSPSVGLEIDNMYKGIDYYVTIPRAKFEEVCADLFRTTLEPVEKALRGAQLDKFAIDEVILVGGSSRIPMIQKLLQDFFNGKKLNRSMDPDEAVASGAAILAAVLGGDKSPTLRDMVLIEVAPKSLGVETTGGVMHSIVKQNTSIPTRQTRTVPNLSQSDHKAGVQIKIFEGDRAMTHDNNLLGVVELRGLSQSRLMDITFDIDVNGSLKVFAVPKTTGCEKGAIMNT